MYRFTVNRDGCKCQGPGAHQPPGFFSVLVVAAFALSALAGAAAAAEPAKQQPTKKQQPAKKQETAKKQEAAKLPEIAYRVNGAPLSATRIRRYIRNNVTMRHAFLMGRSDEIFDEMTRRLVDEELLHQEGLRRGIGAEAESGYFRLIRNAIVSRDYLRNVLQREAAAAVTDEQVEKLMPFDLRSFKVRQIVVATPEEAEEVRRRLEGGEDFGALARELSLGVEARKDGLLHDYEANGGVYDEEQERYLFALPLGVVSRVLETGIGFAVARVEEKKEPRPGTAERLRARFRSQIADADSRKRWAAIVAQGRRTAFDKEALFPLVTELMKTGRAADVPIGSVEGEPLLFSEIVKAQARGENPGMTSIQRTDRVEAMLHAVIDEAVVVAHARKQGFKPGLAAEEALGEALRADVLERLHDREIVAKVTVGDDELLPYFQSHGDVFNVREAAESRILLVRSRAEALRLLGELKAGKEFEALAREHSLDDFSRDKGGYIGFLDRGVVFKDLETAIFALRKPGEVTPEPVRTAFGYYIAQLVSLRPAQEHSFEESKERVRGMIRTERERALSLELLGQLRAKAKIEPDDKVLAKLRKDFRDQMEKRASEPPKAKPHH